jgi:hypothetical protein
MRARQRWVGVRIASVVQYGVLNVLMVVVERESVRFGTETAHSFRATNHTLGRRFSHEPPAKPQNPHFADR